MKARRYREGQATAKDVWRVVRESARKRLGRELLWAYLVLLIVGVVIVVGIVIWGAVN